MTAAAGTQVLPAQQRLADALDSLPGTAQAR